MSALVLGLFVSGSVAAVPAGATVPAQSAPGVDKKTIKIGLLDGDIDQLVSLGFAVPLGDVGAQAQAMVDDINARNGVRGRKLELVRHQSSIIDPAAGQAACIAATQDDEVFAVISPNAVHGSVGPCVTQQFGTPMISLGGSQEDIEKADGLLFSTSSTARTSAATAVEMLAEHGYLKGKTIGIVSDSLPASQDAVEHGYKPALKAAGLEVAAEQVLSCSSAASCSGYPTAVQAFKRADVDVVLSTLGPLSYPAFVAEASRQDFRPLYTATGIGGMTSDVVAKQQDKNGDAFDGAIGVAGATAGWYDSEETPPAFNEACAKTYARHGGPRLTVAEDPDAYGGLGVVCSMFHILERGLEGAGKNPTARSFAKAVTKLRAVDLNFSTGSFGSRKFDAQDSFRLVEWSKACTCWRAISDPAELR